MSNQVNYNELFERADQFLRHKYGGYCRLDNPADLLRHFSSRIKTADLSQDEKDNISHLPLQRRLSDF